MNNRSSNKRYRCNLDKKKGECFPVRLTDEIVLLIHLSFFTLNAGKMLQKINKRPFLKLKKKKKVSLHVVYVQFLYYFQKASTFTVQKL